MRTYKSIERPSQIFGMNVQDIGVMLVLFATSVFIMGVMRNFMTIPKSVFLLVIVAEVALLLGLRYLSMKRAPGFLLAWVSYTFFQPQRISVGVLPTPPVTHEKA